MALWDAMQSFGLIAYAVYHVLFLNFGGKVFPQPVIDFIETIDNILPMNISIFDVFELIFGFPLYEVTWLNVMVGAAFGIMIYSLIKWIIDILP